MKLKQIPNILSVIRILLVFVFLFVFFALNNIYGALLVFLIAGATDVVDGFLARRFGWITTLGKILDPFADKLMQCTVLVSLCIKDIVPLWFVIPFFVKEFLTLLLGFLVIKRRSVTIVSKWYGKAAVALFYATIAIAILARDFLAVHPVIRVCLFVPAVVFAISALIAYIKHYAYLKKEQVNKGTIINNIRKEQ